MPVNPFAGKGIGSRDSERDIASEARAVRAYDQARKRLLATLGAENEALAGINATHNATMNSRMRDHTAHSKEVLKTTSLLDAQGDTLKTLNATRERFHREEMNRTESILQRYESIKQALLEIQEDYKDSTTTIGYMFTPIAAGIDNLSKFGTIGKASRPIRDVTFNLKTLGSDTLNAGHAVLDLGVAFSDTVGQVYAYEKRVEGLRETFARLDLRFGTASGHAQKLASEFINLSRTDINMDRSVKSIEAVTHSLMLLEAQGVDSAAAQDFIVSHSKNSGRSYEETAEGVERLTAQADNLNEMLEASGGTLGRFTATVRDDFVRAIADATRNLDSQVISVENVGAAYSYASMKAAQYGASTKSAAAISEAFVKVNTEERQDAVGFLAGQDMTQSMQERRNAEVEALVAETPGRLASDFNYETATPEEQRRVRDAVFQSETQEYGGAETDANRGTRDNSMRILDEGGLANGQIYNLNRGTDAAMRSLNESVNDTVGLENITQASTRAKLRTDMLGLSNLTDDQMLTFDRVAMDGTADEQVQALRELREAADTRAAEAAAPMEQAISAINTMKDPVQSLLNIKEYAKSIMMNVSNIVSFMQHMGGWFSGLSPLLHADTAGDIAASENAAASRDAAVNPSQASATAAPTSEALAATARMQAVTQEILAAAAATRQRVDAAVNPSQASATADRQSAQAATMPPAILTSTVMATVGALARESPEAGRSRGIASVGSASTPTQAAQPQQQTAARAPAGDMVAVGSGKATVTPGGESVMNVRMIISNMSEVIAHYESGEARLQRAI